MRDDIARHNESTGGLTGDSDGSLVAVLYYIPRAWSTQSCIRSCMAVLDRSRCSVSRAILSPQASWRRGDRGTTLVNL
jgi:hypothetical protein